MDEKLLQQLRKHNSQLSIASKMMIETAQALFQLYLKFPPNTATKEEEIEVLTTLERVFEKIETVNLVLEPMKSQA